MSDFLKSLRTSKNKSSKTRKSMDNYYSPKTDRRQLKDRREASFSSIQQSEEFKKIMAALAPVVSNNISAIAASIERAVEIHETLVASEIEKNTAVTTLIQNLNDFLTGSNVEQPDDEEPVITTSYATGTRYTKDEVLDIIKTMRRDRATFATIAAYLKKKRIPTFSGRGEWHAQTIHRLCK